MLTHWLAKQYLLKKLEEACKSFKVLRDANALAESIQKTVVAERKIGTNLKDLEALSRNLGVFEGNLNANEIRMKEMNKIGKWQSLEKLSEQRESFHCSEVQRLRRKMKSVENELHRKEEHLSLEDLGYDLKSVQTLLRKHDSLEMFLAGLGEKVKSFEEEANRLSLSHPEEAGYITELNRKFNEQLEKITTKASCRKAKLISSYEYQQFMAEYHDLMQYISTMMNVVSSQELANDVVGAEKLLDRHRESRTKMFSHISIVHTLEQFGKRLVTNNHYASEHISIYLNNVDAAWKLLDEIWVARNRKLEQRLDFILFEANFVTVCSLVVAYYFVFTPLADSWLTAHQASIADVNVNVAVENMISLVSKYEELSNAIHNQQEKINGLMIIQISACFYYSVDCLLPQVETGSHTHAVAAKPSSSD
ncbi:spectrin repeat-containing domain protein [Necator americanus]|uniref:Spectrin repeat-containing domain protein n=1 Tax=Necator americanus TaxID=51031 RepID=W2T1Q4_NECAM|nr:spectrin repeat-containing domain protein [Necator americanus]ETN75171.1 spectrin repeat-containing domain protein [Necator americanus]